MGSGIESLEAAVAAYQELAKLTHSGDGRKPSDEPLTPEQRETRTQELVLGRSLLEMAALLAVHAEDISAFSRHFAQLASYYADLDAQYGLPESSRRNMLLGLHLMCLLADNQLADFHAELEKLSSAERGHVYISFAISLEQHMADGSFPKLWAARNALPGLEYAFFLERLLDTAREEIAQCLAAAYSHLDLASASKLLLLSGRGAASPDIVDVEGSIEDYAMMKGWKIVDGRIEFAPAQAGGWHGAAAGVPPPSPLAPRTPRHQPKESVEAQLQIDLLIHNALQYAKELERIV